MKKRPLFIFSTEADLGINSIPVNSALLVENYALTGAKILIKANNTGVGATTTIAQAVASSAVKDISASVDLSTYALKVGPTFTGTVTLPTTTSIGTLSATEIGYLASVTSNVQTQLNGKAPIDSPTFTGNVVVPDANAVGGAVNKGQLDQKADLNSPTFTGTVVLPATTSISSVSATEISYLDGTTSNIQSQLNNKATLQATSTAFGGVKASVSGTTLTLNF